MPASTQMQLSTFHWPEQRPPLAARVVVVRERVVKRRVSVFILWGLGTCGWKVRNDEVVRYGKPCQGKERNFYTHHRRFQVV